MEKTSQKQQISWVTYTIIVLCILAFIQELRDSSSGWAISNQAMYKLGVGLPTNIAKPTDLAGVGRVLAFCWLQPRFWTSMWLHGGYAHILSNMFFLLIAGKILEPCFGHLRFLLIYLLSGWLGDMTASVFAKQASLGASTALFGILLAGFSLGVMLHNRNLRNQTMGLFVFNLILDFMVPQSISLWGHLGGALAGICLGFVLRPNWQHQWYEKLSFEIPASLVVASLLCLLIVYVS